MRTWVKAMVIVCGRKLNVDLTQLRYNVLVNKVLAAKKFVSSERLPPTELATNYHSMRTYLQTMIWMGTSGDIFLGQIVLCSYYIAKTPQTWTIKRYFIAAICPLIFFNIFYYVSCTKETIETFFNTKNVKQIFWPSI